MLFKPPAKLKCPGERADVGDGVASVLCGQLNRYCKCDENYHPVMQVNILDFMLPPRGELVVEGAGSVGPLRENR